MLCDLNHAAAIASAPDATDAITLHDPDGAQVEHPRRAISSTPAVNQRSTARYGWSPVRLGSSSRLGTRMISMRRFCSRVVSVSFWATGSNSP